MVVNYMFHFVERRVNEGRLYVPSCRMMVDCVLCFVGGNVNEGRLMFRLVEGYANGGRLYTLSCRRLCK